MEKDLDKKLYNDYLNGEKDAFEFLYNKYKKRIEYFIYNIVKDYQKAEDITQETFIYIMQNKMNENTPFKYYIYMVAKSRAINYINSEKRRSEIVELYFTQKDENIEKDILEYIEKEETRKEVLEAINQLDEKYKNAVYLTQIENISYEQTAKILGQSLPNTKTLIHRGKKELRKILLKKGFDNMNKVSKVVIMIICVTVLLSGIAYATSVIYNNYIKNNTNHNISIEPALESTVSENTKNNLWIGTLDIAWKRLEKIFNLDKIDIEESDGGNPEVVNALNSSKFTEDMLDSDDYEVSVEKGINTIKIDAKLNKNLTFPEKFDNFSNDNKTWAFADGQNYIKYFGVNHDSIGDMYKNVEILFFNETDEERKWESSPVKSNDFAVKLKTNEGDEIILYRTDDDKSLAEYYEDIIEKTNSYTRSTEFTKEDELRVPYVRVNGMISYNDELYEKNIKNSGNDYLGGGWYFTNVVQDVNFNLNESGCNLSSTATIVVETEGIADAPKYCYFDDKFVIFMKEADSDLPYFALKVDNDDILEKVEELSEPKIVDFTTIDSEKYKADAGEIKFYEDENYEYYFTSKKLNYVQVYFPDGSTYGVKWALEDGKITIDLLDKYGIEYIKKEK